MIKRGFKVFILITTYILTVALFYSWKFLLNSARSHWLLRGHMTSNNETVSRQNLRVREQCKKSRRQRVTVSSHTARHLRLVPRETVIDQRL